MPDHPLHNKIRFKSLQIWCIDHSVLAFLRANQQIWDKRGTNLDLYVPSSNIINTQPIWNDFLLQIWPIFAPNIRHLGFPNGAFLDHLRRLTSPTLLTDCNQLNSINSYGLCPDAIADDGPNATAGQALSKWLHNPGRDGQPKQLRCNNYSNPSNVEWANNFKEKFLNATTSVHYKIIFIVHPKSTQIVPFELMNERTKEKLILIKPIKGEWHNGWIMKRCKIWKTTTAFNWEYKNSSNLNNVQFLIHSDKKSIGPFSPPAEQPQ